LFYGGAKIILLRLIKYKFKAFIHIGSAWYTVNRIEIICLRWYSISWNDSLL